ncbi:TetR/AcrR family transcriptional regulator [Promicromonospora sp. NPDC057138]|uniref:TetR/AcrR family transcriptional regulator n=1 Tax=Promicromonospora sp. NPDC057138 TaxID=3346031 RepID=UPI00363BAA06
MVEERQRGVRADALANRERILAAGARLFRQHGVNMPLDAVAKAAGVGSATLHRHFSGRVDLVHSVLDAEADRLAARAAELQSVNRPEQALRAWLLELVQFSTSFRGLATLLAANDADTTLEARHYSLTDACRRLLVAAQDTGHLRTTIDVGDLLKLANGIAVASAGSADVAARLFEVVMDGLQTPAPHDRPPPARRPPE